MKALSLRPDTTQIKDLRFVRVYHFIRTRKKQGTATLRFRLKDGKNFERWLNSDIYVDIASFDQAKGTYHLPRMKAGQAPTEEYKKQLEAKKQLEKRVAEVENAITDVFFAKGHDIQAKDFPKLVDKQLHPDKYKRTFLDLFDDYVTAHNVAGGYVSFYNQCKQHLARFEAYKQTKDVSFTLDIKTFDTIIMGEFVSFLSNEDKNFNSEGEPLPEYATVYKRFPMKRTHRLNDHTILQMCNICKIVVKWACGNDKTFRYLLRDYKWEKPVYADAVYLTIEERDMIAAHTFTDETMSKYRDAFIFQCLTGERISDLMAFKVKNIAGGWLNYIPIKTRKKKSTTCRVPLNDVAKDIAFKYSRGKQQNDTLFDFVRANTTYNKWLKKILTECGITRFVEVTDAHGNADTKPLNEIAGSHIARKTFCGNLYKKIHDPNLICKMSGHAENSRAFSRYHKIDDDDLKEVIALL